MANIKRNFSAGKMNKSTSLKQLRDGEYRDALNVRVLNSDTSTDGNATNTPGNSKISTLKFGGSFLSADAVCLGSKEDPANSALYWVVHDPNFLNSPTGKVDMIVSFSEDDNGVKYHIVSVNDGGGTNTTLNLNPQYPVKSMDIVNNILFINDDYNQPREIYTDRNYIDPSLPLTTAVDGILPEEVLVIKRPPSSAPGLELLNVSKGSEFMSDRFISFAYRYRYADNQYSATSDWTPPAFAPSIFNLGVDSFLNEGMKNNFNAASIKFNSGSRLVEGIDIMFKEYGTSLIKVVEQINKVDSGYVDDTEYVYQFSNSKVFTTASEAEILRVGDAVPMKAGCQTVMGSRLMFGNYEEGEDMLTAEGSKVKVNFSTELNSEEVASSSFQEVKANGVIGWTGVVNNNSVISIDFGDSKMVEGGLIIIDLQLSHDQFSGDTPFPSDTTDVTNITLSLTLSQGYNSVHDLINSTEFQARVGTISDMTTACDGNTWTDNFNCLSLNNLDLLEKYESGIDAANTPIKVTSPATGSSVMNIQIPATSYVNDKNNITQTVYEYLSVDYVNAQYRQLGISRSLHSNRGYEVSLFYEDGFKRRSTALTSNKNTVFVPCSASDLSNKIKVSIPKNQKAPAWAERYGFAVRADKDNYDTIYSKSFFKDVVTNDSWFLLEGEQARKVESGDTLIVKADTSGPLSSLVEVAVLEKGAKESGFINDIDGQNVPTGVYMKIKTGSFITEKSSNSTVDPAKVYTCATDNGTYTQALFPMNIEDPSNPGQYIDYSVPAGSVINFTINTGRRGTGSDGSGGCPRRDYHLTKKLIASTNYENMYDWFIGDNVAALMDTGSKEIGNDGDTILNEFLTPIINSTSQLPAGNIGVNYYQFIRNTTTNKLEFAIKGTRSCGSRKGRKACTDVRFIVNRAQDVIVFETQPSDTLSDTFFYGGEVFSIDNNGYHLGNVTNQTATEDAELILSNSNCYSFGNGVESYKILDSIVGKTFDLGTQATAVGNKEYKRVRRTNDIIYGGIYSNESNVNRFNEFNAGLFNYKHLEDSFGPLIVIDGRKTDVLAIHQNKVTYVLAGKNLLSDATGQSLLTSVPEVLGTQIAMVEDFGITDSSTYARRESDKFWLDERMGAVVHLQGQSGSGESLSPISNRNMRNWFKNKLKETSGFRKKGGIDPFTGEYLLTFTNEAIPKSVLPVACGDLREFSMVSGQVIEYNVDVGPNIGNIRWTAFCEEYGPEVILEAEYNGTIYGPYNPSSGGQLVNITKDNPNVQTVRVKMTSVSDGLVVESIVNCPEADFIKMKTITLSVGGATTFITNKLKWTLGSNESNEVEYGLRLGNGPQGLTDVSEFSNTSGQQGSGILPPDGATIRITARVGDLLPAFPFDINSNKFRYLRSTTEYSNTTTDINALVAAAAELQPIADPNGVEWYADQPMTTVGQFLYIIYDYR